VNPVILERGERQQRVWENFEKHPKPNRVVAHFEKKQADSP